MVGLYETAIDALCDWELDGRHGAPEGDRLDRDDPPGAGTRSMGSSRAARGLPAAGPDVDDNFFAVQRDTSREMPGRRYLGICAPGESAGGADPRLRRAARGRAAPLRASTARHADPWMTLVGYFNSLRELGGMRRLVEDDVDTRAFRVDEGRPRASGRASRGLRSLEELTSRHAVDGHPGDPRPA